MPHWKQTPSVSDSAESIALSAGGRKWVQDARPGAGKLAETVDQLLWGEILKFKPGTTATMVATPKGCASCCEQLAGGWTCAREQRAGRVTGQPWRTSTVSDADSPCPEMQLTDTQCRTPVLLRCRFAAVRSRCCEGKAKLGELSLSCTRGAWLAPHGEDRGPLVPIASSSRFSCIRL